MFRWGNAVRAKSSKRAFRWLGFGRVWRFSANPIVRIRAWLGSGLGRAPRGGGIPSMSNGVGHAFCPITRVCPIGGTAVEWRDLHWQGPGCTFWPRAQRSGLIAGMQKKRPGGEGSSAGPNEGMMRCLAHRSALRDKQKQGEEGNLSLAGSQYSERRWRPYVRPVAVL